MPLVYGDITSRRRRLHRCGHVSLEHGHGGEVVHPHKGGPRRGHGDDAGMMYLCHVSFRSSPSPLSSRVTFDLGAAGARRRRGPTASLGTLSWPWRIGHGFRSRRTCLRLSGAQVHHVPVTMNGPGILLFREDGDEIRARQAGPWRTQVTGVQVLHHTLGGDGTVEPELADDAARDSPFPSWCTDSRRNQRPQRRASMTGSSFTRHASPTNRSMEYRSFTEPEFAATQYKTGPSFERCTYSGEQVLGV
ncbi:uncharacterized protein LOC119328493 [Triticum dicoccoides]|uniref:uncharacterized protein LOC119328493 n=1 Tax=Triticum dicoccoides TaxID=85692 RepID=UPI001890E9BC|nr:uncharacterized protein LOC119328493 [Triticum dicoccoides]